MYESPIRYETKSFNDDYSPKVCEYTIPYGIGTKHEFQYDYDSLITEDDEPVDNLFSERQMKFLTDALYTSWTINRPFLACANVGIYDDPPIAPPIVPDVLLSMDVIPAKNIWEKKNRCYMIDVFKKPPDLVIEVVSNRTGNERTSKFHRYESMDIKYYVIFDPDKCIFKTSLHVYRLHNGKYKAFPWKQIQRNGIWFSDLQLGLKVHQSIYQKMDTEWLLWSNHDGDILLSGEQKAKFEFERAEDEKQRAEKEKQRAEKEKQRAEDEKQRADTVEELYMSEKQRANEAEQAAKNALKELALLKEKLNNKL
ncbi:MAG: hypothetical protein OMM_05762 [Candidatus Magnetoglobus multicellularis str. Araruama]|uniref:Putative restriction endonuclease domain-containing protein n=1 Tax=Candidatus Magnetoglobus multicellularis str. Araruama TaxID=890399 RepID=A0A1V1NUC9_9BACT|nr:MAG: hypothetical protein OMM_05762 [Candidatus Magnetoglobus multicellularis str. Araruama]